MPMRVAIDLPRGSTGACVPVGTCTMIGAVEALDEERSRRPNVSVRLAPK